MKAVLIEHAGQKKMKGKKEGKRIYGKMSQAEIIGLLIIVVMISMILLFTLSAMVRKKDDGFDFKNENLRSAMIGAITKTSAVECQQGTDIEDLLIDCGKNPSGGGTSRYSCMQGSPGSCAHAGEVIGGILDETLDKWRVGYEFIVCPPAGGNCIEKLYFSNGSISSSKGGTSSPVILPITGQGSMQIWLCFGGCPKGGLVCNCDPGLP